MTREQQIEEIAKIIRASYSKSPCTTDVAEEIYSAGYRKTFISDLASDTQKAFKEGYIRGNIDGMSLARKETAKEIFTKLIEVAKNNDNKLSIGLLKAWAIEYGVDVEE